jgi:dipeptidyl aminopeptidase/acylaminoacyl peptidase
LAHDVGASDPFLQRYERSLLGDPVKNRTVYDAASPITYLHHTQAQLLVLQGDNDARVPKEEALQVFALLRGGDGRTVEAHFYPNEGHEFSQRDNRIDALKRTVDWFDRYLKDRG